MGSNEFLLQSVSGKSLAKDMSFEALSIIYARPPLNTLVVCWCVTQFLRNDTFDITLYKLIQGSSCTRPLGVKYKTRSDRYYNVTTKISKKENIKDLFY